MPRAKKKKKGSEGPGWLVTFADLVTLLLTFFVLLLSMSTLTITTFTRVDSFLQPLNLISQSDSGNIPQRVELILHVLRDPDTEIRKARVKDLLFPYEAIPKEMNREKVLDNLDILLTEEGVVIVISDAILFEHGEFELGEENKQLLKPLYDVLFYSHHDVNISAHTDNVPVRGFSLYEISNMRALSVLNFFLTEINVNKVLKPRRLSISSYGPDRPIANNNSSSGRARNRRIEILLKHGQWGGGYQ